MNRNRLHHIAWLLILASCSGDPSPSQSKKMSRNSFETEIELATTLPGVKIDFHASHFYTPASPNPETRCAGDAHRFFHPLETKSGLPLPLPDSLTEPGFSVKPSFLKNVSVDLTDAGAETPYNQSLPCARKNFDDSFQPSLCASFDSGAVGGNPNNLGGSLALVGGVKSVNYAAAPLSGFSLSCGSTFRRGSGTSTQLLGTTLCLDLFALLGIDVKPGGLSSFLNFGASQKASFAKPVAGGSLVYSPGAESLYLFGGSQLLQRPNNEGPYSADSFQTAAFSMRDQKWVNIPPNFRVHKFIFEMPDCNECSTNPKNDVPLKKTTGSRASFGYAAVPAMSLNSLSTTGQVQVSQIDTTERIVVSGGLTQDTQNRFYQHTFKFNPTYGPEWVDALGAQGPSTLPDGKIAQWVDSHFVQLLNNLNPPSLFRHEPNRDLTTMSHGFGFAPLRKTNENNAVVMGSFAAVGGFNQPTPTTSTTPTRIQEPTFGGLFFYGGATKDPTNSALPETVTANYSRTAAYSYPVFYTQNPRSSRITELVWIKLLDGASATAANTVPHFGGVNLLPGFNLNTNDLVYFGGSTCRDYLVSTMTNPETCLFSNPGRYWSFSERGENFGSTPQAPLPNHRLPQQGSWNGTTAPERAGMASARGEDGSGKIILVAWGGLNRAAALLTAQDVSSPKIHILYDEAAPKWTAITPSGNEQPELFTNSALVYSHITRKFYAFGGVKTSPTTPTQAVTHNETWELSVSGACPSCEFRWRKLTVPGGLGCYPASCPAARRSHRMTEVNYHATTLEPLCNNPQHPCSFGIFMEGGVDGNGLLLSGEDRWMFDPTANRGFGHWQYAGNLPPRHFASLAPADFKTSTPNLNLKLKWLLLFGGETALQNPQMASPGLYFVPPTLGDTQVYDTVNQTWNRVELLGKGYKNEIPSGLSIPDRTEAFVVRSDGHYQKFSYGNNGTHLQLSPEIAELSPPPLSGSIAVTRTHAIQSTNESAKPTPLEVQEIFLFGGRKKDGHYLSLDHVYKFCPGSAGERLPALATNTSEDPLDFALCEPLPNPYFKSQSGALEIYPGRWLRKIPTELPAILRNTNQNTAPTLVNPQNLKSFLGAGAYDLHRDKITFYGGLGDESHTSSITEADQEVGQHLYEYTPPTKIFTPISANVYKRHGYWVKIPSCSGYAGASDQPPARYGHSMAYDPLHRQFIIAGGFDKNRNLLTQTFLFGDGRSYTAPEIWTAKRIENPGPTGEEGISIPLSSSFPCIYWQRKTSLLASSEYNDLPAPGGLGHAPHAFIPAGGYNSGYYSLQDSACIRAGTHQSDDPTENKRFAGGVYFNIDRQSLKQNENLLLHLTFFPVGPAQMKPDGTLYPKSEMTFFKIHLMRTEQSTESLRQVSQPRYLTYNATANFPKGVQTLTVLASPTGGIQQEQILLPLSANPTADTIRIERDSGSAILIDATLMRMGSP